MGLPRKSKANIGRRFIKLSTFLLSTKVYRNRCAEILNSHQREQNIDRRLNRDAHLNCTKNVATKQTVEEDSKIRRKNSSKDFVAIDVGGRMRGFNHVVSERVFWSGSHEK